MFSIANLIERAKAGAGIDSDYRLAKVIGITHASVSTWRMGKSLPNEKVIQQLCALSGDDPGVIAAEIQAARSKSPEAKSMWLLVAKRLSGVATTAILSVLFAIGLVASPVDSARASGLSDSQIARINSLYIVSSTFFAVLVRLRRFYTLFGFISLSGL